MNWKASFMSQIRKYCKHKCIPVMMQCIEQYCTKYSSFHFFSQQLRDIIQAFNLEGVENVHQLVTSQWIFSNLIGTLEHHLTCVCKVRKHGTLMFRQNTDCLSSLSQALWKLRNTSIKQPETHKPPSVDLPSDAIRNKYWMI